MAARAPGRLIFLPGSGASPDFWRPLGDRLPTGPEKVYPGWPGLGREPHDPAIASLEDLVGLVEGLLERGPADLLAQSMGGYVALQAALRRPERVRRLVLSATSGGLDLAGLGGEDWRPAYRREFPAAAPWICAPTPDLSAEIARLTHPVLLIWGDADPISPLAAGERLAGLLPRARLHVVPGGGHDVAATHAAQLAPMIAAHLA